MAGENGSGTDSNENGADGQGGTPNGEQGTAEVTFDGWYGDQDDAVKSMVDGHISGLKSALDKERGNVKDLAKQLKDLGKAAEEGSDLKKQIDSISAKLEEYETQNAAYETFAEAGVTNFKLAWIAAQQSGAIDKRGNVNLETLRQEYPELFGKKQKTPAGNAGSGTGSGAPGGKSMNDFIRTAAGRK